ncbi:energy-coupling factor transport system substrate-specific component [Arthrobacter alpinus]|uniref:Energy-coupling factor transport system substrate-specific component n=1 Tax=Arthrobacter alpinus TaxID=656366 RepID=A0A1H5MRG7_9MICC|nr:ECF transporter S component [Arthrobacter alpinus]SEE90958.1 energy-coupling factor transport system substrate-specific component [Arthrobacter alpinus]
MSKSFAGESAAQETQKSKKSTWRVVDIVVVSVLGVAVGVIFWLWSAGYGVVSALTVAFPPLGALYGGGWLIAGVLGALVIRKPGAALYCELIAATVEGLLGTHFGFTVLLSGLVQGLGAELGFAIFRYRKFNLPVALLAGALAGLAMGINDSIVWNVAWAFEWKAVYVLLAMVSGAVIAGLISWLAVRGLARTGALASLPSRGAATERAV